MIAIQTLVVVQCYSCSIEYAIPNALNEKALDRTRDAPGQTVSIYCPNGHSWCYIGENEAQKLERRLRLERDLRASIAAERDQATASLRATRGVVTKLRKRADAGACPFGCRRHFVDLERHVATRHPGQALEGEA